MGPRESRGEHLAAGSILGAYVCQLGALDGAERLPMASPGASWPSSGPCDLSFSAATEW